MTSRRDFLLGMLKAAAATMYSPSATSAELASNLSDEKIRHEVKKTLVGRWVDYYADSYNISFSSKNPEQNAILKSMNPYEKACYGSSSMARIANLSSNQSDSLHKPFFQETEQALRNSGIRKDEIRSILEELKSGGKQMLELWEVEFIKVHDITREEFLNLKREISRQSFEVLKTHEGVDNPEDFIASKLDEILQMTPEQLKALREKANKAVEKSFKPKKVFADMASARKAIYPGCKLEGYEGNRLVNTDAIIDGEVYFNQKGNSSCESKGKYTELLNKKRQNPPRTQSLS